MRRGVGRFKREPCGRGSAGASNEDVAYPERFAQQALGHNSKAVHHAYSKHAEVTVPSLDDWEKDWQKNPQGVAKPKLLPVDFRSRHDNVSSADGEMPVVDVVQAVAG
jgi:hypothetical protein